MLFKKYLIIIALIILIIPSVFSFSPEDTLQKYEKTAERYDDGEITLAQMIVLFEHHHDEKQKKMNEENFPGWSKSELEKLLEEYKYPYGYVMKLHDVFIFLGTWSDDGEHYDFGYSVGGRNFPESYYKNEFEDDIKDLVDDLRSRYENGKPSASEIGKKLGQVFAAESERDTYEECVETMNDISIMNELDEDELPKWFFDYHSKNSRVFSNTIHQLSEEECIESHNCGDTDYCIDLCRSDTPSMNLIVVCARDVAKDDKEPAFDFVLEHNGYESGIDYTNFIQEVMREERWQKECEPWGYKGRLYFREKLQESLDKEFFDWYVEDFLGDNIDKYLNPTSGFERLMSFFHQTSERISNTLQCKGTNTWPDGFEKVDIDYKNGNIEFHVWEEKRPVDFKDVDMWSTLYKYKVMGDKDMMRKLIEHQLSEESTMSPPKHELDKVKQNEQVMEVLNKLTGGFGESLDFSITLKDDNEDVFTRYVSINDDTIFKVSEDKDEVNKAGSLDFSVALSLDNLHDFANSMTSIDSEKVYGPSWLETKEPMMIKERIELIFKLWNSVDVEPWTTKIKLSTKIGSILDYIKSMKSDSVEEKKMLQSLGTQVDEEGNINQDESSSSSAGAKDTNDENTQKDKKEALSQDAPESVKGNDADSGRDAPGQKFLEKLGYTENNPELAPVKVKEDKTYSGSLDIGNDDKIDIYEISGLSNGDTLKVEVNPENNFDAGVWLPNKDEEAVAPGGSGNKDGYGEKESDSVTWNTDEDNLARFMIVGEISSGSSGGYTFSVSIS